jgi:hypothetical protein
MAARGPARVEFAPEARPSTSKKRRSDEAISEEDLRNARTTIASINKLLQEWVAASPGAAAAYFPLEALMRIGDCLRKTLACMEHVREKGWTMQEGYAKHEELENILETMMSGSDLARIPARHDRETVCSSSILEAVSLYSSLYCLPRQVAPMNRETRPQVQPQRDDTAQAGIARQQEMHNQEEENQLEEEESETSEEDESEEDESGEGPEIVPQVKEEEQDYYSRPSASTSASTSASAAILRSLEHTKKRVRVA